MKTLDELGIMYGTDKSSKGHNYLKYYEHFFDPIRYKEINLLEIGIDKGDSVRAWREYFPHSEIHGIDIRGDYEHLNREGITTHVIDQSNRDALIVFGESFNQYFDIIIEDGSHKSADQVLTFETLFPYLKSGGFYCCEDLLCDYDERWHTGIGSIERFKQLISDVNMNGKIPNDNICANKTEAVKKYNGSYLELNVEYLFSSCGLVIIKKI